MNPVIRDYITTLRHDYTAIRHAGAGLNGLLQPDETTVSMESQRWIVAEMGRIERSHVANKA